MVVVVLVQDLGLPREEHVAWPVEDDAAPVDDDDASHDLDERIHLVGDDEHRHALGGQPAEHLGEHVLVGGVDPGGRLVHEQDVGLGGERTGDEHPALLSAREGAHVGPGAVGEADDVERTGDDLAVGGRRPPNQHCRTSRPVATISSAVARTDPRGCAAGDVPEAGVVTGPAEPVERGAEQQDLAAELVAQPEQALDDRRLPGAVRAEDRHDLAGEDVEGDVADHGVVRIPERRPAEGDDRLDGHRGGHQQPWPALSVARFDRITSR